MISSATFDLTGEYLGISSNTGTVHLFSLRGSVQSKTEGSNVKSFFSLEKSVAKLHLQEKMGCSWTTKESSLVGPMISFSRAKGKFVISLIDLIVCGDTVWIVV